MAIGKTFRLTVQERIMIHLSDYSKYIDNIEVPFSLTQEGIAQAIGVVRSAIPRAIKKLISKNYVKEILAHVTGVSRRRKVYHLTTEGLISALGIKDKLQNIEINLIDLEDNLIKCKVKEVSDKLGNNIKLLEIIFNLDEKNNFNYKKYKERKNAVSQADNIDSYPVNLEAVKNQISIEANTTVGADLAQIEKNTTTSSPQVHFIEKAPKLTYFVGRKNELDTIKNCISDTKCKMVVVHGIAGIGKTTLAAKVLEILQCEYNIFWYRFHEWDTLRNILGSISKYLLKFNKPKLKQYLDSNQNIDVNEIGELLENDFQDMTSVFLLDDFHKINGQLIGLFTLIREILERKTSENITFLIFSRSFVPFYDRRDVLVKKLIFELELTGLNESESKELLKFRDIKIDNFKQLYKLTQGHPLSLELLDPSVELQEQKNIKLYLEEEVLNRLSLQEKSLLKIASVFRYPVPAEGFFIYEKAQINRETLSILTRKALIKDSREGFEVHDLIRDFFYSYLTTKERTLFHGLVGKFYLDQLKIINDILKRKIPSVFKIKILDRSYKGREKISSDYNIEHLIEKRSRGILETQYHFLKSEDFNRAVEVALILGHELLNLTYVEEQLTNLDEIERNLKSEEYQMDLKILKADSLAVLGNFNESQRLYQQSVEIADKENNKTKLSELYVKLGYIKEKLNEFDSAIQYLNKSLDISETIGDAKRISDAYGSLGDVYWKMTQYDKSNEYYNKCLQSAEAITDLPGKAKTFLSLGIQSAKHGQLEESLKYYERCLDILDKGKELNGISYSNLYENLGDHYLKTIFSFFIQNNSEK
jgi:tetratricopeptide (TPR) repeat protein